MSKTKLKCTSSKTDYFIVGNVYELVSEPDKFDAFIDVRNEHGNIVGIVRRRLVYAYFEDRGW